LDPKPLDEGPRPKRCKSRLNLHGTIFEGKINWTPNKKEKKRTQRPRARDNLGLAFILKMSN